jgi:hypothetical protein
MIKFKECLLLFSLKCFVPTPNIITKTTVLKSVILASRGLNSWSVSIVCVLKKNTAFLKLDLLPSSVYKVGNGTYSVGSDGEFLCYWPLHNWFIILQVVLYGYGTWSLTLRKIDWGPFRTVLWGKYLGLNGRGMYHTEKCTMKSFTAYKIKN